MENEVVKKIRNDSTLKTPHLTNTWRFDGIGTNIIGIMNSYVCSLYMPNLYFKYCQYGPYMRLQHLKHVCGCIYDNYFNFHLLNHSFSTRKDLESYNTASFPSKNYMTKETPLCHFFTKEIRKTMYDCIETRPNIYRRSSNLYEETKGTIRICIHIRRGDTIGHLYHNYRSALFPEKCITNLIKILHTENEKKISIHVYSDSNIEEELKPYKDLGVPIHLHYKTQESIIELFNDWFDCDILIPGNSSLSLSIALLKQKGIVVTETDRYLRDEGFYFTYPNDWINIDKFNIENLTVQ